MTIAQRSFAALLGLLLGAQAVGKLVDMQLYASALGRFHAVPEAAVPAITVVWVSVEILAFGGLGAAALRPRRALMLVGAAAALIDALAYAALTIGTSVRGSRCSTARASARSYLNDCRRRCSLRTSSWSCGPFGRFGSR